MTIDDLPIEMVKITGTPGGGFWSQVHTFTPQDLDKKTRRGSLLTVITVATGKEGVEAVSYGRDILQRFHEEYYGSENGSPFECLKKAIVKIVGESPSCEVAAAVIVGGVIILAVSPGGTVWLKRGQDFGVLLDASEGVRVVNGRLVANDMLLLSSSVFNQAVSVGTLRTVVNTKLSEISELIGSMVLGHEQSGGAAGLFIKVSDQIGNIPVEDLGSVGRNNDRVETSAVTGLVRDEKPVGDLYLKSVRWQQLGKKLIPIIGGLVVVALLVGGAMKATNRFKKNRLEAKGRVMVAELKAKVDRGAALIEEDPVGLNELVVELDSGLQELEKLNLNQTEELASITEKIMQLKTEANQVGYIKEPVVYMDLGLVEDGMEGNGLAVVGNNLLVLSQKGDGLVVFNITKKAYKTNSLDSTYNLLASDGSNVYLIGQKEIARFDVVTGKAKPMIEEGVWQQTGAVAVYLGNVYLLDQKKPALWRFPAIESGLGIGTNWFKEEINLTESVGVAVDGSVWIVTKDGVNKYSLGKKETFGLGEGINLVNAGLITTSSESKELLVLDKSNGRLYRIAKDGKLVKSYQSILFKGVISLTSDGQKAYLLDGKKIYEIGLE